MTDQALSLVLVHHRQTSFLVRSPAFQHLITEHQQGVRNGHRRRRLTLFFGGQPPELLLHKTVLFAGSRPGTFGQRAAQPAVPFGGSAALVLARTAVIARTYPRPRTQVLLPSTAGGERSSWKGLAVRYYSTN